MTRRISIAVALAAFLLQTNSALAQNNPTTPQNTSAATTQNPGQPQKRMPAMMKRHLLKPGDAGYEKPIAKLPPDFPAPVYPNAVFDSANEVDGPGRTFYARFHVQADIDDVARWYKSNFTAGGWTISSEPEKDINDAVRLVATKTIHTGCSVRLTKQPDYVDPKKKRKPGVQPPKVTQIGISVMMK